MSVTYFFLDEYSLRNFQNKKKFFTRGFKITWVKTNFFTTKTVFGADSKKSVQKIFRCQLVKLTRLKSCGKSFLRIPSLSVKISHLIDIKNIFGIHFWNQGKKVSLYLKKWTWPIPTRGNLRNCEYSFLLIPRLFVKISQLKLFWKRF